MHDAPAMPLGQRVRELNGELERQVGLDRLPRQKRAQRLARHEFVGQEELAVFFTEVEQRGDVGVGKRRGGARGRQKGVAAHGVLDHRW